MSWRYDVSLIGVVLLGVLLAACESGGNGANRLLVPPKGFVSDAAQGKQLFARNCATCHGLRGSHSGPPLLHKVYEPSHHSDLSFYMAVNKGVRQHHWQFGNMPPITGVSPEEGGISSPMCARSNARWGSTKLAEMTAIHSFNLILEKAICTDFT
jgi:hypothetical protein